MRRGRDRAGLLGALGGALRRHLGLLVPVQEPRHLLERPDPAQVLGELAIGCDRVQLVLPRLGPELYRQGPAGSTPGEEGLDSTAPGVHEDPMTDTLLDRALAAEPLTAEAFAPFGDVIEAAGPSFPINDGMCDRFHDLARMEFTGEGGRCGISLGDGRPFPLPHVFTWSSATRSAARPSCR